MDVDAFIFNWPGHEENAVALAERLGPRLRTTVINSDVAAAPRHRDWVHLGEEAYFSAQWNAARERLSGDVLFHVQADALCSDVDAVLGRALAVFARYGPGVYEPNPDYTAVHYARSLLPTLEPDLCVVPLTDCTCWFVAADLVRTLPPVDVSINRFGWGVCAAVAALGGRRRRPCLRDYRFTIEHPRGRGYPASEAVRQRIAYIRALPPSLRRDTANVYRAFARVHSPVPGP
jgi:hypothetical protein